MLSQCILFSILFQFEVLSISGDKKMSTKYRRKVLYFSYSFFSFFNVVNNELIKFYKKKIVFELSTRQT